MTRLILFCFLSSFSLLTVQSQHILPERERAEVRDQILEERFKSLLPELMEETGIDMWVIIAREYNEDPVLRSMLPATWLNARRRTMLLFYRDPETGDTERLAVARYKIGESIESAWDKEKQPDQWKRLVELIEERNPDVIGVNISDDHNIADGLVKTDYELLMEYLPKDLRKKVTSAEELAVRWIETRTDREMMLFAHLVSLTHEIIEEAFSEKVITPGVTTTTDVEWWMRQKVTDLGLETWFHPTVDVQRSKEGLENHLYSFSDRPEDMVILPGDLLHCDFGITYLGLNTDCQELAYVLRPGETEAPDYLQEALAAGNSVQDHLTSSMEPGLSGNEILRRALKKGRDLGMRPAIYTHPLGTYGHSAGTTIGMWDAQDGVASDDGENYPLRERTAYAIELNTTVTIPEWQRDIRVMLEEAGYYGPDGFRYVNGRQTELLLIPRVQEHQGN